MKKKISLIAITVAPFALAGCLHTIGDTYEVLSQTYRPGPDVSYGRSTFPTKFETTTTREGYVERWGSDAIRTQTREVQYVLVGGRWVPCGGRDIGGKGLCDTPEMIEKTVEQRARESIQEEGGGGGD